MHLKDLKKNTPAELVEKAEHLGVESASTLARALGRPGSMRLVRPFTASDRSAPRRMEIPARSPSFPFASPITK